MDTQIAEKLREAQTLVDILNSGRTKELMFVFACVDQLLKVRSQLANILHTFKGETGSNEYIHIASVIDMANTMISKYGYEDKL